MRPAFSLRGIFMKVLVFDQSTRKTGWAVFVGYELREHGLIDCDVKSVDPQERFEAMCRAVCNLIVRVKPEFVVLEGVAFQRNAATLIELAQLQGVIIGECYRGQIEFYIYPPSSWRKDLGFKQGNLKRAELKVLSIQYVEENYGMKPEEDLAEAICIGTAFLKTYFKEKDE